MQRGGGGAAHGRGTIDAVSTVIQGGEGAPVQIPAKGEIVKKRTKEKCGRISLRADLG